MLHVAHGQADVAGLKKQILKNTTKILNNAVNILIETELMDLSLKSKYYKTLCTKYTTKILENMKKLLKIP